MTICPAVCLACDTAPLPHLAESVAWPLADGPTAMSRGHGPAASGAVTSPVQRMRGSFPRQVDKKSRGPQGERSGILKEEERTNFLLFSFTVFRIIENNVSCLRTVCGLNLLANSVILKCKLWE